MFFACHSPQSQVSAIHCKLSLEAGCPCLVRKSLLSFYSLCLWPYFALLYHTVGGCTLLYTSKQFVAVLFYILFNTYCRFTLLYFSTQFEAVLFYTLPHILWLYLSILCTLMYTSTQLMAVLLYTHLHSLLMYSFILFHTFSDCSLLYSPHSLWLYSSVLFHFLSCITHKKRQFGMSLYCENVLPGSPARNTADSFTLSAKLLSAQSQDPAQK